jgi:hypothetical protein
MKKNLIYLAILVLIATTIIKAQAGEHIKDAVIVIKSPTGQTYKATTDASGRCVFRDVDGGEGKWSVQMTYQRITFKAKEGASLAIVDESSSSSSKSSNPLYQESSSSGTNPLSESTKSSVKSPRDVATGQASGKRTHKPFSFSTVLCPDGRCADGTCEITLESDGTTIVCMAVNQKGTPGGSTKSNK